MILVLILTQHDIANEGFVKNVGFAIGILIKSSYFEKPLGNVYNGFLFSCQQKTLWEY